jgi:hypothetical protein
MADLPLSRPDPAEVMRELEEILKLGRPDDEDRPTNELRHGDAAVGEAGRPDDDDDKPES